MDMLTHQQNGVALQILVLETLDAVEAEWFEGFTHAHTRDGETVLEGVIPDQAALRGVLDKIFALGLTLLEVRSKRGRLTRQE